MYCFHDIIFTKLCLFTTTVGKQGQRLAKMPTGHSTVCTYTFYCCLNYHSAIMLFISLYCHHSSVINVFFCSNVISYGWTLWNKVNAVCFRSVFLGSTTKVRLHSLLLFTYFIYINLQCNCYLEWRVLFSIRPLIKPCCVAWKK